MGRKDSPLHWTPTHARMHARTHARTHAHTHEGGRRGWKQTGREAGRQADREGGGKADRRGEAGRQTDREGGEKAGRLGGRREGRQTSRKGMFVVFSPWDCSKCFTLHPLAELFIPNPSRLHCCYIEDT